MSIRIKNNEYLDDVASSIAFTITKYPINPGLRNVFPFLSQLAQNYEQFFFHSLVFYFKTTSANALNSTNTALGTAMMAVNYDVLAPDFTSKFELMNYGTSKSKVPSRSFGIRCKPPAYKLMWVRSGSPPANADLRLYDVGNFYFAGDGSQAAADIGELHVSYDVTLIKPKLSDALGWDTSMAIWYTTTGIDATHPFGTAVGTVTASSIDIQVAADASITKPPAGIAIAYDTNRVYFNPSYGGSLFLITLSYTGGSAANVYATPTFSGCSAFSLFTNYTTSLANNAVVITGLEFVITQALKIDTGSGSTAPYVQFTTTMVLPAAVTGLNVMVTQIPPFTSTNSNSY